MTNAFSRSNIQSVNFGDVIGIVQRNMKRIRYEIELQLSFGSFRDSIINFDLQDLLF